MATGRELEDWIRNSRPRAVGFGDYKPGNKPLTNFVQSKYKNKKFPSSTSRGVRPVSNVTKRSRPEDLRPNPNFIHHGVKVQVVTPETYDPARHRLISNENILGNLGENGRLKPGTNIMGMPTLTSPEIDTWKNNYSQMMQAFPGMEGFDISGMGGQYPVNGQFNSLDAIMEAIGQVESGGNYFAQNPNDPSGAFGKYQILGTNIGPWTAEALGRTLTPQQFLNDPAAQDATARYFGQKYLNAYGSPQAVARAWNAGPGRAMDPNAVPGYVNKFQQAFANTQGRITNPGAVQFGGGGWALPIAGSNPRGSNYGVRSDPFSGEQRFHNAIDLAAAAGTSVMASTGGQVLYAGWDGAYGNTIVMSDPTGRYQIRYAHLNSIGVAPGQTLGVGMPIGTVGSTGRSTGPHLHFEVTSQGQPVDPRGFF